MGGMAGKEHEIGTHVPQTDHCTWIHVTFTRGLFLDCFHRYVASSAAVSEMRVPYSFSLRYSAACACVCVASPHNRNTAARVKIARGIALRSSTALASPRTHLLLVLAVHRQQHQQPENAVTPAFWMLSTTVVPVAYVPTAMATKVSATTPPWGFTGNRDGPSSFTEKTAGNKNVSV